MNQCTDQEYRCANGMCIPEQFFLDGEFDCLDWSDEIPFKQSESCSRERAKSICDDHVCLRNEWSCGDGQCTRDRLEFQQSKHPSACYSGRDQYFMCETHKSAALWTMPNGRCYGGNDTYEELTADQCELFLKCSLSRNRKKPCPCSKTGSCAKNVEQFCPPTIQYPKRALVAPFVFFVYNHTRDWLNKLPDIIRINGTVRCGSSLISVIDKIIPFTSDLSARQILEDYFCRPTRNISWAVSVESEQRCRHAGESTNRCQEWNPCMSKSRMNDGSVDCLNKEDEVDQTDLEIEESCAPVQRHRFRCSSDQSTCLSVTKLGDSYTDCRNKFDRWWLGEGREISSINCNEQKQDECELLHQYIRQAWTLAPIEQNEMPPTTRISFRFYCDTFWDLASGEDENLFDCRQSWICSERQERCGTGQCYRPSWRSDYEWDCADASDESIQLRDVTELVLKKASRYNFSIGTCNQTRPFLCLSATATQQGFSCLNFSQIGDGHIDCAGATDERMTLPHCTQPTVLGPNFRCPSTKTCIPYYLHCFPGYRCPNRSDDELWCSRQHPSPTCGGDNGFTCFNGHCMNRGRCTNVTNCLFAEDKYMCDYVSSSRSILTPYRQIKRLARSKIIYTVALPLYPLNATTINLASDSIPSTYPTENLSANQTLLSPYWCNRGLGILSTKNHSVVCFCPPYYYGDKCEYQADRLSVLLYLNLSRSVYALQIDSKIILKVLVLFLFRDRVLMREEFQLRSVLEAAPIDSEKMIAHFLYPRTPSSLEERRKRLSNRSSLLYSHPYSIRVELYETWIGQLPSLIAVWKYPLLFDYLPVSRLSKVLHLADLTDQPNPCISRPCHLNQQCYPLMNDRSQYVCLCKEEFAGENCSREDQYCRQGYCSKGSLCQSNPEPSPPFCLCPSNRLGVRCAIEHDRCSSNPCLNNGSCISDAQIDQFICLCTERYRGHRCQYKRPSIHLSVSIDRPPYDAAVIQFLRIERTVLNLTLEDQQVFTTLPTSIENFQYGNRNLFLPDMVLAKIYSEQEDLYLLSVHRHLYLYTLNGTTQVSPINQCAHLRTFSNKSSPIRYHQICSNHPARLCFRDDVYLCICAENHTRAECFLYDEHFDRCTHCLSSGRCFKGDPREAGDFLCLCPPCHSGRQCQFSTKSFSVTLDQLFSFDLLSARKQTTIALLVSFSLLAFVVALPSNLFSFVTLRQPSCLRQGVGHYLLWMSIINQLTLVVLIARLLHFTVTMTLFHSPSSLINDLSCKLLSYLLTYLTRLSAWLPSLVALERAYTVVFVNKHWFKQPHIARSLIMLISALILLSAAYELAFVRSFTSVGDAPHTMCVMEYPSNARAMWITIHQIVTISHILLPMLINLCSTLTIIQTVVKVKMNLLRTKKANKNEVSGRATILQDLLMENREIITRPAVTFVPSIFSLFSLPMFIISFSLGCQNLDENPLRYLLIVFYFLTFVPQLTMFGLYIYPSSFYWKQWQSTSIGQRFTTYS